MTRNNQKKRKNKYGFSLLELLVVIAIIAILVAVGVVAYSTARRKGADAQRRSNIKAVQDGFEQYFTDNGSSYAGACDLGGDDYFPAGLPDLDICNSSVGSYCICVELEDASDHNSNHACDFSGNTYYCLTNLQ